RSREGTERQARRVEARESEPGRRRQGEDGQPALAIVQHARQLVRRLDGEDRARQTGARRRREVRRRQEGREGHLRPGRQRRVRIPPWRARRGEGRQGRSRRGRQVVRRDREAGAADARADSREEVTVVARRLQPRVSPAASVDRSAGALALRHVNQHRTRRTAVLIALGIISAGCHAASAVRLQPDTTRGALRRDIDAILDAPALGRGYWAVVVRSLTSGETLYERNARRLMMPASNLKIVTLAAAAARLGWDYRYETQLFAAGTIDGGALRGDLVVVGAGDPSIMSSDADAVFGGWADALKHAGVGAIAG